MAIGSPHTTGAHVEAAWALIRRTADDIPARP
jgi:hypothetical protein